MARSGTTARLLKEMPYEQRICRTEHYPMCLQSPDPEGGPRAGIQLSVDSMADAGVQAWTIAAMRHRPGGGIGRSWPLWPSAMIPRPAEYEPGAERLREFIAAAHQRGIFMMSYYPFIFTTPIQELNPDWGIHMLDDGGEEVWNEGWLCWNSPYRDWLPRYLSEMIEYFDLDGVYFDDMNWGSHSDAGQRRTGGCICRFCREQYLEECGRELPPVVDMEDADFRSYIVWRYGKFIDGVEHVARGVYAEHPDVILDWNYYGRPYGSPDIGWMASHPLNPLPTSTRFFMEAGLDNLGVSFPAKLLRAAGPTFGFFFHAARSISEVGSAPDPEPHTGAIAALSAVVRGGATVTVSLDAGAHTHHGSTLQSIYSAARELQPYVGGEAIRHAALHVSQQGRDFQYYPEPDEFWKLCRGSDEMLKRSQILTEVVFDRNLTLDTLRQYKVLVLSNSGCLGDGQVKAIREFVHRGGCLVATHRTSLCDELGRERGNFALAEVLGVDYAGAEDQEAVELEGGKMNPGESNILVPQTEELKRRFGHFVAFGAPQSRIELRPDSDPEILFTKSSLKWKGTRSPLGDEFYAGADFDSGEPALSLNRYGKGTAIYLSGDLGQGYYRDPLSQLKRLMDYLVRTATPALEVEAPEVIDATAFRRKPGQLMIHLLNNPLPLLPWSISREDRPNYFSVNELLPVRDVVIRLNEFRARAVRLPLRNQVLHPGPDGQRIVVPAVDLHEVVLVDLAE